MSMDVEKEALNFPGARMEQIPGERNLTLSVFFVCLLILSQAVCSVPTSSNRLEYTVRPSLSDSEAGLIIEMGFRGGSEGQTKIFLPDQWAGQEDLHKSVTSLTSLTEDTTLEETDQPHILLLHHNPGERVRVRYTVKQQWSGKLSGQRFQKYWPIIDSHYFHFIGFVLFAYPENFRSGEVDISLKWIDFPRNWTIGNSFGCSQSRQRFKAQLEDFRRAVYLGGDYRIKKIEISGQPVYTAIRGGDWDFSDAVFVEFINSLVSAERKFWNDHQFPYFFIALNPFGKGHKNRGGTGLYQSFDVFLPSDAGLDFGLKFLFAHELFHTWNTGKLGRRSQPEQLLYWFTEGFTDYYARLLLLRADLITLDQYVSDFNDKLKNYYTSPVRDASNQMIYEGYWTDEHLGRLPYQRGDIIAHRWNSRIRTKTEGRRSLDDVMRALFDRAQKEPLILNHEVLVEEMARLMGKEIETELRASIESGGLIEMAGGELGSCYEMNHHLRIGEGEEGVFFSPQFVKTVRKESMNSEQCLDWFGVKSEQRF